ncbi:hypothetical protein EVAR_41584_1 [Eumeta japonica]|uniref:Uncharacterized protein n=1 Tax=Eumeta variegata TaxID=151549 RepID=A0A4C1Y789_EUMVA|nr:hypothetical protein EVAR_41584_1 [Eumeta japonica]
MDRSLRARPRNDAFAIAHAAPYGISLLLRRKRADKLSESRSPSPTDNGDSGGVANALIASERSRMFKRRIGLREGQRGGWAIGALNHWTEHMRKMLLTPAFGDIALKISWLVIKKWSPPPMNTRNSRGDTNALPASRKEIGYLMEGIGLTEGG